MKYFNTCTPLFRINRHYITSNITLLNKHILKLALKKALLNCIIKFNEQYLIYKGDKVGLKHYDVPKGFIEY